MGAGAMAGAAYFLRPVEEPPVSEVVEAGAPDASVDARAPKAKPKPGKKAAPRGGKTRVASAPPAGTTHRTAHAGHGPSYESALDSNDEHVTIGAKAGRDLSDAQLSAPMSDGSFLGECGAPESMSVTVKVAIRHGHAVGVSVDTSPASAEVASCIDHHVRGLSWPASPKLDSLVTTY